MSAIGSVKAKYKVLIERNWIQILTRQVHWGSILHVLGTGAAAVDLRDPAGRHPLRPGFPGQLPQRPPAPRLRRGRIIRDILGVNLAWLIIENLLQDMVI